VRNEKQGNVIMRSFIIYTLSVIERKGMRRTGMQHAWERWQVNTAFWLENL